MRRPPLASAWLVLALAACVPADEGADEAAPGSTTPAPDPQGAPRPGEQAWVVTPGGAGPVRVGMPLAAAAAALGARPDSAAAHGGCGYLRPPGGPAGVKVMVVGGTVARVEVDSGTVRTAEGAGVGDPEARVRGLYPGRVAVTPHKYLPGGRYLTVAPQGSTDGGLRLLFETDGTRVARFRAGRLPEVEWVEGCA